jgi:hypothetical protein
MNPLWAMLMPTTGPLHHLSLHTEVLSGLHVTYSLILPLPPSSIEVASFHFSPKPSYVISFMAVVI